MFFLRTFLRLRGMYDWQLFQNFYVLLVNRVLLSTKMNVPRPEFFLVIVNSTSIRERCSANRIGITKVIPFEKNGAKITVFIRLKKAFSTVILS